MELYKKILVVLIGVFLIFVILLLRGTNNKLALEEKNDIYFPLDEKGYPQNDIVMINNKSYPIKIADDSHIDSIVDSEIVIKMDEESEILEVILPQYLPVNNWSVEEKKYMDLVSYSRIDFPIKDKYMAEGVSATVQKFQFKVAKGETTEILLKWSNIEEVDNLFKDKKENYLLKIKVF